VVFTTTPVAHAAEINPELAELVTRFYQPTEEESLQISGMSRAAHEASARRTERFLKELAAIDRSSLATSDRIDYEYMVDFFEGTGTSRGQAHVEATQITNIPAHDVGYYIGVVEIKNLMEEYRAIVGADRFDLKEFHTALLLAGNVPVALIRPEILERARMLALEN